uniref:Uncharacterized protein n=1 Tax=Rangifer tarandus platyrhynchus TaxID=3082113 RepID=A0ACB0DY71_RANTA|nr:unnamed protein product [Rangifer tarandus platyrhynchus]
MAPLASAGVSPALGLCRSPGSHIPVVITFKLAKRLAEAPGTGGQRGQPALRSTSRASRQGFPGGAGPSPHRPATSQTYLRVAGRGLR